MFPIAPSFLVMQNYFAYIESCGIFSVDFRLKSLKQLTAKQNQDLNSV